MGLSSAQFADVVNTKGGESRHAVTGEPAPKRGYMISEPEGEEIVPAPLTEAQVDAHHAEHVAHHTEGEVYQGGWKTKHQGEPAVFLDVSKRYEKNWGEARDIAEAQGQYSSYHGPTDSYHYSHRQMPGPQSNPDWVSSPDRPSNYERDSAAVEELKTSTGLLNGTEIPLEDVLAHIAEGRMNRAGHGR